MFERKWHAVYTRPGKEKRIADLLTKKKIKNYLPLNKIERQESRGKKIISEPLFPGYVFLYLNDQEQASFYQTPDIINFVYWLNKPVVINNDEINAIRHFLNEYSYARLEKIPVKPNDDLRAINEPLMRRNGNVLEVAVAAVKLMLPSLGHMLIAEVIKDTMEEFTYPDGSIIQNKVA
jgi:transcription antitermination factor NusG